MRFWSAWSSGPPASPWQIYNGARRWPSALTFEDEAGLFHRYPELRQLHQWRSSHTPSTKGEEQRFQGDRPQFDVNLTWAPYQAKNRVLGK
jgi:hypothetical protein